MAYPMRPQVIADMNPPPPEDSGVCLLEPPLDSCDVPASIPAPPALPVVHVRFTSEARFRAMYDTHVDFVWRNLRRLGVPTAEADDRAQEVFVIAHRRFDQFEDRGHGPRAWLFQIVLRVASDARRHRRRHPEDPDGGVAEARESTEPQQTAELARREALDCLDRALATIDVNRRAVLVLHEIEEMTAPEIAEVLSIPLNTVYSRLRVARVELEQAVTRGVGR
jgi:RNA polymerase sigma-70 factor (ECF subfamily)